VGVKKRGGRLSILTPTLKNEAQYASNRTPVSPSNIRTVYFLIFRFFGRHSNAILRLNFAILRLHRNGCVAHAKAGIGTGADDGKPVKVM